MFKAASPQYTSRILQDANIEAHLYDPTLLPNNADSEKHKYITCYDPATGVGHCKMFFRT